MKEEDQQHQAFLSWYGELILERKKKSSYKRPVKIDDNHALLERAFRAGWSWAETLEQEERHRLGR